MNLLRAYYVAFLSFKVFTWRALPEVWRLVTPFFITGPKFGLLMDPYFLWTYSSQLELEASRFSQPGDFFTYIIFVCSVILVSFGNIFFLSSTPTPPFLSFLLSSLSPTNNLLLSARPVHLS